MVAGVAIAVGVAGAIGERAKRAKHTPPNPFQVTMFVIGSTVSDVFEFSRRTRQSLKFPTTSVTTNAPPSALVASASTALTARNPSRDASAEGPSAPSKNVCTNTVPSKAAVTKTSQISAPSTPSNHFAAVILRECASTSVAAAADIVSQPTVQNLGLLVTYVATSP